MSGLYPTLSPSLAGMLAADTGAEMIGLADGRTLA